MNKNLVLNYLNHSPKIAKSAFLSPNTTIIGQVFLGDQCSVFYGSVLRGDINYIKIGFRTNVQDNCTFHVSDKFGVDLGDDCTIGHNAVLHACKVGSRTTIGMSAVIMDGAEIGEDSLVAAGSLVPPGKCFPPGSLILGNPAKKVRDLTTDEIANNLKMAQKYLKVVEGHKESLRVQNEL